MGYQSARDTAVSPRENSVSISRALGFVGRGLVGRLTNRNSCALGVDRRGFEKSARKKLLESAAKALKSLSGINLCAAFFRGGWCCLREPSDVQPGLRRQERGVTRRRHTPLHAQFHDPWARAQSIPLSRNRQRRAGLDRLPPSGSANQARLRWKFDDLFKVEGLGQADGP